MLQIKIKQFSAEEAEQIIEVEFDKRFLNLILLLYQI